MPDVAEIFDKIMGTITNKPLSLYQIVYITKINARTVQKYLAIIDKIQNAEKIVKVNKGARVLFRRG